MRRLAFLGILLGASPGLRAEPAETPFLIFREADPATEKECRELITEKQLGGRAADQRRKVRERLAWIGPWSVPSLATAIQKESSARIRLNAVITLMLIRDPRGLPALRVAAADDREDKSVRRAATLAIGAFENPVDVATLKSAAALAIVFPGSTRGEWTTVAPALAKLRQSGGAAVLLRAAQKLPTRDDAAAAILLAAAIASPDAPLVENLEGEKLVQQAAAAGLAIRPLPPSRASELITVLGRSKLAGPARVLAIRALGAIDPRPADAREKLLDLACKDGPAEERIAALLELDGAAGECEPLLRAYRERNDPVMTTLLFALARTREEKAVRQLKSLVLHGSDFVRYYAAASLLAFYPALDGRLQAEVRGLLLDLKGTRELEAFVPGAQRVLNQTDKEKQAVLASEVCSDLPDPRDLRLFVSRKERNWLEVNRLFATILELDEVLEQYDSARPGREPESPLGGGGGDEKLVKPSGGTVEEQDLFDILLPPPPPLSDRPGYFGPRGAPERKPYFGPGDLGAG